MLLLINNNILRRIFISTYIKKIIQIFNIKSGNLLESPLKCHWSLGVIFHSLNICRKYLEINANCKYFINILVIYTLLKLLMDSLKNKQNNIRNI